MVKGQDPAVLAHGFWNNGGTFWPHSLPAEPLISHQKVGHAFVKGGDTNVVDGIETEISFRNSPEGTNFPPALSVPIGHRSILAEVRAPVPPRHMNPVMQPHRGSAARGQKVIHALGKQISTPISMSLPAPMANTQAGWTMSRGNMAGRSTGMDAFTWLSNVKVDERRGESNGRLDSVDGSRPRSRSRPEPGSDSLVQPVSGNRRSESRSAANDNHREGDGNQSLQDECVPRHLRVNPLTGTTFQNHLSPDETCIIQNQTRKGVPSCGTKGILEIYRSLQHDLTKKRTCTLGLHGPWGESSSVFIRVSFTFPRDYPYTPHPLGGTPSVDLERNPLISMKDRAFILRRLRLIREQRRPCLEACLRFLLFANEDEQIGVPTAIDPESSSEDETTQKVRDQTVFLLRNNKNLAEPRTSQGVFGPNGICYSNACLNAEWLPFTTGELIRIFRAPPRIVRRPLHTIPVSPTHSSTSTDPVPRLFQSPALLSDAVRRLQLAATDRLLPIIDPKVVDDRENILRIMTNLLTFSQQKLRRDSESLKPLSDIPSNYSLLPSRSTVLISKTTDIAGADRKVAQEYIFDSTNLAAVCEKNAITAMGHGRYDHQRVFRILGSLFSIPPHDNVDPSYLTPAYNSQVYEVTDWL